MAPCGGGLLYSFTDTVLSLIFIAQGLAHGSCHRVSRGSS